MATDMADIEPTEQDWRNVADVMGWKFGRAPGEVQWSSDHLVINTQPTLDCCRTGTPVWFEPQRNHADLSRLVEAMAKAKAGYEVHEHSYPHGVRSAEVRKGTRTLSAEEGKTKLAATFGAIVLALRADSEG